MKYLTIFFVIAVIGVQSHAVSNAKGSKPPLKFVVSAGLSSDFSVPGRMSSVLESKGVKISSKRFGLSEVSNGKLIIPLSEGKPLEGWFRSASFGKASKKKVLLGNLNEFSFIVESDNPKQFMHQLIANLSGWQKWGSEDALLELNNNGERTIEVGSDWLSLSKSTVTNLNDGDRNFFSSFRADFADVSGTVYVLGRSWGGFWRQQRAVSEMNFKDSLFLMLNGLNHSSVSQLKDYNVKGALEKISSNYYSTPNADDLVDVVEGHLQEDTRNHLIACNLTRETGNFKELPKFRIISVDGYRVLVTGVLKEPTDSKDEHYLYLKKYFKWNDWKCLREIFSAHRSDADYFLALIADDKSLIDFDYEAIESYDVVIAPGVGDRTVNNDIVINSNKGTLPQITHTQSPGIKFVKFERKNKAQTYKESFRPLDSRYGVNELGFLLEGYGEQDSFVLPDSQRVLGKEIYSNEDAMLLASESVRIKTGVEVVVLPNTNMPFTLTGDLNERVLASWLYKFGEVNSMFVNGSDLIALLSEKEKWSKELAVVGLGDDQTVGGFPINPSETYSVLTTEKLVNSTYLNSLNAQAVESKFLWNGDKWKTSEKGQALTVEEIVISHLKSLKERTQDFSNIHEYKALFEDQSQQGSGYWVFNVNSLRFDYSRIATVNNERFSGVEDSRLQTVDQETLSGQFDATAVYRKNPYHITLGSKGQYAHYLLKNEGVYEKSILMDDLIHYSNLYFPIFSTPELFGMTGNMGPMAEVAYDTQFQPTIGRPFDNRLQGFVGWQLTQFGYIQSMSLSAMNESRLRSGARNNEWGYNARSSILVPIKAANALLRTQLDYRHLFRSNRDTIEDLKTRFTADIYLDVPIGQSITIGPYYRYLAFTAVGVNDPGIQSVTGISLNVSGTLKPEKGIWGF